MNHFLYNITNNIFLHDEITSYNCTNVERLVVPMSKLEANLTVTFLSIIIVLTLFGNTLVITAVFKFRYLRNVQNMFLVSLAAADITVALLPMPLNVAYTIMGTWIFGIVICKIWLTCDVMCCTASILNLCAIALDRYWAIHDPINYAKKRTLERVLTLIAGIWISSFCISLPPLLGWNDWSDIFTATTPCALTEEKGFVIYSSMGSFYIPLIIMSFVYWKIYMAAKRRIRVRAKSVASLAPVEKCSATPSPRLNSLHSMKSSCFVIGRSAYLSASNVSVHKNELEVISTIKDTSSADEEDSDFRQSDTEDMISTEGTLMRYGNTKSTAAVTHYIREKQKICLRKERRAARVLGIVMGVFVICWLPFFLMYLILPFCEDCYISKRTNNFIVWLGYVNSALNPVIYTIFNKDFRKAFRILLKERCKKIFGMR